MKQLLSILVILNSALCIPAFGQLLPHYSQYMFNNNFINPAVAGTEGFNLASFTFRNQWAGFNDAPTTQVVSMCGPLGEDMGFGGILLNDKTGPRRTTGMQLTYAYRMQVFDDGTKISLGISGIFYQHVLDMTDLKPDPYEPPDNVITGGKEKKFAPDAAFGVYYYTGKYYAGFSVPQLFQNELQRHFFFTGGYKYEINDNFDIEPSFLFKAVAHVPAQLDINAKLIYQEKYWSGLSYRHKESIIIMLGIDLKNKYLFGFSYDITLTQIRKYSIGSHEIYLAIKFPAFRKKAVL